MYEFRDEEARKARREYQRLWRRNNPDKIRAAQEKYWRKRYHEAEEKAGQ